MEFLQFLGSYYCCTGSNLGKVALPPLSGSAFLFGADLGVNSVEILGVECLGALPVETTCAKISAFAALQLSPPVSS